MPRDAVGRLLVQDGPRGRVQPGVSRQRTVVKIEGAQTGQTQDPRRDDREVGDAEQVVESLPVHRGEGVVHVGGAEDLLRQRPFPDRVGRGHDGLDRVAVA